MTHLAIVVAAGRGSRAGTGRAKQYMPLAGRAIIAHSLASFARHPGIDLVLPVIHPDDAALFAECTAGIAGILDPVVGGATRQESVRRGLEAAASLGVEIVLIHDAARPFVTTGLIDRAIAAATAHGAAVPVIPLVDSLVMVVDDERRGSVDRETVRAVQTPQAFRYDAILAAHRAATDENFTDDGAVAAHAGLTVATFSGEAGNMKITTAEDFARADAAIAAQLGDIRIGNGFDVHAFGPGDHIMLAGVRVPHEQGLVGHSDADVGLHALTDAILGAIAHGDIGSHFPPSDPQWKGAASHIFLREAARLVAERGGVIAHLDLTIMGEAPKVGPWRDAMREAIAGIVGIPVSRVGVKATTTERLGFTGRREGLAAQATATVRMPFGNDVP